MATATPNYFKEALGHIAQGGKKIKKFAGDALDKGIEVIEDVADKSQTAAKVAGATIENAVTGAPTGPDKVSKLSKDAHKTVKEKN